MLQRSGRVRGRLPAGRGHRARTGLVVAGALAALLAASTAAGASTRAGGALRLWMTPTANSAVYKILITGAIGDFGTATSIDRDGKVDTNGNYVRVALRQGGFEINSVALDKRFADAAPTTANLATCSFSFSGTGPVTVFGGTRAYKGISGTIEATESYAGVGPLYASGAKAGRCNMSNSAQPVASYSSILGVGSVTFG